MAVSPVRLRGFETTRDGAPTWARDAIAQARAGQLGIAGGSAASARPRLGVLGLALELGLMLGAAWFVTAATGGGMGILLLGLLLVGFAGALVTARLSEYRHVRRIHPGGHDRPSLALCTRGVALEQDGRVIALPWQDVIEIVALPPHGLGRHGAALVFVVSPQRRSPPWVQVLPSRFGLSLWDLLPEAERLRASARRIMNAGGGDLAGDVRAPYRESGREELGARARELAENTCALASAMVRAQPIPGCFHVPPGSFSGRSIMFTPSALIYRINRGAFPIMRRLAWSDVAELDADGDSLRVRMREPDDDVTLHNLAYPALLVAAIAVAYLKGAVPLARI